MNRAVFLDRDGTINADRHYLCEKKEFVFLPGVIEGMKKMQEMGFLLIIITNQSGIARGYYTEKKYRELERWMLQQFAKSGIRITDIYYCPHLPGAAVEKYAVSCKCRKPKLGLFQKAVEEHEIDISKSVAVGDNMRDLAICENGVTKGFLVYAEENKKRDNIFCLQGGILQAAECIEKMEDLWNTGS